MLLLNVSCHYRRFTNYAMEYNSNSDTQPMEDASKSKQGDVVDATRCDWESGTLRYKDGTDICPANLLTCVQTRNSIYHTQPWDDPYAWHAHILESDLPQTTREWIQNKFEEKPQKPHKFSPWKKLVRRATPDGIQPVEWYYLGHRRQGRIFFSGDNCNVFWERPRIGITLRMWRDPDWKRHDLLRHLIERVVWERNARLPLTEFFKPLNDRGLRYTGPELTNLLKFINESFYKEGKRAKATLVHARLVQDTASS